ncbi:hypothetical protein BDU57DRAFT_511019 [Ampelomyces quisqualis]|uniref:Uncharacterized protein n=1 Tax=Ampelomyces quisqualis TaxID=50730 RepID=A0A6A5R2N6_AMPQU|nr:hypothetical protein BDU57DRAFT_511019 [Ampelomyces quisqualis]
MLSSATGITSIAKQRYHYPQSVAQSHDGDTYDLQSLRSLELGESVSVAGRPWRQNHFAARRQGFHITAEQYEATQRSARVEFRPLCQDVMSRYNADMSRSRRAYESDQISPEQYKIQVEFNEKNKRQALKHSADQSGYVILEDEPSIFRAITTPDGYAIYHDLLNTTNPVLWQKLVEQLHNAQTPQSPTPKSRESSFDQARHAVGKMARFVLATPSDPELKTFSTRMKSPEAVTAHGMFLSLMDPKTAGMLTSGAETESRSAMREKERTIAKANIKGKGKAPAVEPKGVDMNNIGTASQSRLTGTTALNNGRSTTAPGTNRQSYASNTVPEPARPHSHGVGTTAVSAETMWPEGDSQGGWRDVSRPVGSRLRGGADKSKSKKSKSAWFNVSMAQAMLLHG